MENGIGYSHLYTKIDSSTDVIDFSGQKISCLPFEIPTNNSLLKLILAHNKMMDLPSNLTHVESVILSSNNFLYSIPQNILLALLTFNSLKILDLSYNEIEVVQEQLFQIKSLKRVNLFHNKIGSFPNNLMNSTTIQILDIGYNLLSSIPQCFQKLSILYLDHNLISSLDTSFEYLTRLSLSKNEISDISIGLHFPELLILDISYNKISQIPNLNELAPKLRNFDAAHNCIENIPILPKSLTHIYLSNNKISYIDNLINSSAIVADLSFNQISELLDIPSFLISLDISNNVLNKVNPINSENLSTINFSNNSIEFIPYVICQEMKFPFNSISNLDINSIYDKITLLDISGNNISIIPCDAFMLPSLKEIRASFNNINDLPIEIKDSKIITLDLSFNPISQITVLPLELEHLFLNYCKIQELPSFLSESNDLVEISMAGNFIGHVEALPPKIKHIDLSFNKIKILNSLDKCKELVYCNFSNNLIEIIPEILNLKYLRVFDLSFNPILKEINLNSIPPKLRFLNLSNINISSSINITQSSNLLRYIDISNTCLNLFNICKKAFVRNSRVSFKWFSFATFFGRNENSANIVYERLCRSLYLGFFNDNKFINEYIETAILEFEQNIEIIDFDFIQKYVNELTKNLNQDTKPFSLFIVNASKIMCIIYGDFQVLAIDMNGDIFVLNEPKDKTSRYYGNPKPKVVELSITLNTKYILISQKETFHLIPPRIISAIARTFNDAHSLSHCLMIVFSGINPFENSSIFVIDVEMYNNRVL